MVLAKLVLALMTMAGYIYAGEPSPAQFYGQWKITGVLGADSACILSTEAAERLVGQTVAMNRYGVRFAGNICSPIFDAEQLGAAQFDKEFGMQFNELHLREPITVFDVDCMQIIVLAPDKILINRLDWYFEARKISEKPEGLDGLDETTLPWKRNGPPLRDEFGIVIRKIVPALATRREDESAPLRESPDCVPTPVRITR